MKRQIKKLGISMILGMCACYHIPRSIPLGKQIRAQRLIDRGILLVRSGDLEQARGAFELSAQIHPSAAASDGLGCVALGQGEIERASGHFARVIEMDQHYRPVWEHLALLKEMGGDRQETEEYYGRAMRLNPESFALWNNLAGYLYDRQGGSGAVARGLLRKAAILADHPIVNKNLSKIRGQ